MISLLNPQANERIELADFVHVSQTSILGLSRSLPEMFLTSSSKGSMWIVRGFACTSPSGQLLSVAKGAALLSLRSGAQVVTGIATNDGADVQSLDLSSYVAGTYNVYVRFVLSPDTFDTRTFYRASGGGEEYGQSVPTRLSGNWELAVRSVTPGEEWLQIAVVTTPSMTITDTRPMYFEGRIDQSTASGWGSTSDRSTDRASCAVGDLQTALASLRQGLEDIKGPGLARWYTGYVAGQTIGFAGTPVASRTQWADANFYAQGDTDKPMLVFGADGAHVRYKRSIGVLSATGPDIGAASASASTAFALRSGATDEALLRGGFYRSSAQTGFAALDASWSRGAPGASLGGVAFYGASGVMGGSGVGLGYSLGAALPALFVGSTNTVGVGAASASQMLSDTALVLQVPASAGLARQLAFTDGAKSILTLGASNAATSPIASSSYTGGILSLPNGAPLLFVQGGKEAGVLTGGTWLLGPGASAYASSAAAGALGTLTIAAAPSVVTSTDASSGAVNYANTPALLLNSNTQGSSYSPLRYATRMTFANQGVSVFNLDGGAGSYALTDVANAQAVYTYSTTTKLLTFGTTVLAPAVKATSAAGSYGYQGTYAHTNTFSGLTAKVVSGTMAALASNPAAVGAASVNNTVVLCAPIQSMQGQQWTNFTANIVCNAAQSVTCAWTVARYDTLADMYYLIYSTSQTIAANTSANTVLTTRYPVTDSSGTYFSDYILSETCNPRQCWFVQMTFTSSASFNAYLKYFTVDLTTPALNPQRQ